MMAEKERPTVLEHPLDDEMSPTSKPTVAQVDDEFSRPLSQQDADVQRVERKEAMQFWGRLVGSDNCGSQKLNNLLIGIANYIARNFEGQIGCPDLTPAQLAAFYRSVGGNYDVLFVETQHSSIAYIYKALGCLHSLQPASEKDCHEGPQLPALKRRGFVKWQTVQLLLGPDEHVPFLQEAVRKFDIVDPVSGQIFPKILPEEAFPSEPDEKMLRWYDQVHDQLQQDLQSTPHRSLSLSDASDVSGDERTASTYFRNPMYHDPVGRPTLGVQSGSNHYSSRSRASRQPSIADRSKAVFENVRHFISPPSASHHQQSTSASRHDRRPSFSDRPREHEVQEDYEDLTPTGFPSTRVHGEYRSKPAPRVRTKSPPQEFVSTDSDSDPDTVHVTKRPQTSARRTSSRDSRERELRERNLQREIDELHRQRDHERKSANAEAKHSSQPPNLRHRRSYEPQVSPVDYFPRPFFEEEPRRHSHVYEAGVGGFAPSQEPSMASRVARISREERRASPGPRVNYAPPMSSPKLRSGSSGSYTPRNAPPPDDRQRVGHSGRPTVQYSRRSIDEDQKRRHWDRERERDRDRDRERDSTRHKERPRYERSSGARGSGEHRSDEHLTKPHVDVNTRSRSYDRSVDAERLRNSTRYVQGTGGRKYPSTVPWQ